MRPDCLEKMFRALQEHPAASFAYSSFKWEWKIFKSYPYDVERLKKMNYINMASLVRHEHHPGFDPAIKKLQDWDIWLTMLERGHTGVYIPEVLYSTGENLKREVRVGISRWLPAFMYKIPWHKLGIHIGQIDRYRYWTDYIQKKHHIA